MTPSRKRIEEELLKLGIHNWKELNEAIEKMESIDISIFVTPLSEEKECTTY